MCCSQALMRENCQSSLMTAVMFTMMISMWMKNSKSLYSPKAVMYGHSADTDLYAVTVQMKTPIWEFEKSKKNGEHPTMKPVPLLCYPIMNSSMSNTIVLDPFGGSGSTLIACEQTDRSCYTIELDEKYCDVIIRRYIEQVGTDENVSVLRNGEIFKYSEVVKKTERENE